jgi:hypothetical protein
MDNFGTKGSLHAHDQYNSLLAGELFNMCFPPVILTVLKQLSSTKTLSSLSVSLPTAPSLYISGASTMAEISSAQPLCTQAPHEAAGTPNAPMSVTSDGTYITIASSYCATWMVNGPLMDGGVTGCIEFRCLLPYADFAPQGHYLCLYGSLTPDFSGYVPASTHANEWYLTHSTSGALTLAGYNSGGVLTINVNLGVWHAPTIGTEVHFSINWDVAAGVTELYVQGAKFGNTITTTMTRTNAIYQFNLESTGAHPAVKYRQIGLFKTRQRLANFTPALCPYVTASNGALVATAPTPSTSTSSGAITAPNGGIGCGGAIVAGLSVSAANGQFEGFQCAGGTWYKIMTIPSGVNSALDALITTSGPSSEFVTSKHFCAGAKAGSAVVAFSHTLESGAQANQCRVVAYSAGLSGAHYLEIDQEAYTASSAGTYSGQQFTPSTGQRLYSISVHLAAGGTAGDASLGLCLTGSYKNSLKVAVSNATHYDGSDAWYEFVFPTYPQLTVGNQCSFVWQTSIPSKVFYTTADALPGNYWGWWTSGTDTFATNTLCMTFKITTLVPSSDIVDLYAIGKAASTSNISLNSTLGAPLWTDEGTGTYPTSHSGNIGLLYDTDDGATCPPNMPKTFGDTTVGKLVVDDTTDSSSITTGASTCAGGGSFQKNLYVGGLFNCAQTISGPASFTNASGVQETLLRDPTTYSTSEVDANGYLNVVPSGAKVILGTGAGTAEVDAGPASFTNASGPQLQLVNGPHLAAMNVSAAGKLGVVPSGAETDFTGLVAASSLSATNTTGVQQTLAYDPTHTLTTQISSLGEATLTTTARRIATNGELSSKVANGSVNLKLVNDSLDHAELYIEHPTATLILQSSGGVEKTDAIVASSQVRPQFTAVFDPSHTAELEVDATGLATLSATNGVDIQTGTGAFSVDGIPVGSQSTSVDATFVGPWLVGHGPVTIRFTKTNTVVTCYIPAILAAWNSNDYASSGAGVIPDGYRPVSQQPQVCRVVNNSIPVLGEVITDPSGNILVLANLSPGTFSTGGNCGWAALCVSWITN